MKRALCFLLLAVCFTSAKERRIELPKETPTYPPGKGSEVFAASCLTCHSTEYISTQPKMPRKFWEATVVKMKDKFGATIADEASVQELAEYLTTNFGK
jgi:mono/diheme cytochrome c family protein